MTVVIDKHKAMLNYLMTCPVIQNNPLFFNFGEIKENSNQFITTSNAEKYNKTYIDGVISKNYLFTLLTYKTISYNAIVKTGNHPAENIDELAEFQQVIDWIDAQEDARNYPNFGNNCSIEEIKCTTANPVVEDVNADLDPAIATYSVTISVDFLDKSKSIWAVDPEISA